VIQDHLVRYFVGAGGISVVITITLIFFYLFYEVIPIFSSVDIHESQSYSLPGGGMTIHTGMDEYGQVGVRFVSDGRVIFFNAKDGKQLATQKLLLPGAITAYSHNIPDFVSFGTNNGQVLVVKYVFDVSYPENVKTITPRLEYPLGVEPLVLDESEKALSYLAIQIADDSAGITATTEDGRLLYAHYTREESFLNGAINIELDSLTEIKLPTVVNGLLLDPLNRFIFASEDNALLQFNISDSEIRNAIRYPLSGKATRLEYLLGDISLLVGLDNGQVQQWMPVRTGTGRQLTLIRTFREQTASVSNISAEHRRKGFAVASEDGRVTINYSTSHRTLASFKIADANVRTLAWTSRGKHLLVEDDNALMHVYQIDNEYPEISWDVLWAKVWYEGYDKPDYIWQSSASNQDFEPKLSLVPLSFGTIKAAVYAMLFAIPIALLGAIFTAQFMAPRMRQVVKPSIEIMEALPTVILGFLAGLWLAPLVEAQLTGIFALLIVLPIGFVFCAWCWQFVPRRKRFEGWEAALLIPVVLLLVGLSMSLSQPLEQLFFNGDLRGWLQGLGIDYDQRNSLVVGLIMGFAVIPTIFSIAEDALFSVPQHLIHGSLALGATRWQTLVRVVLPAASPGIFSALMMGFGRAVGETMIVLMATGNTPVMDMSIFQGMRTLSASIAVEIPEAEVASTHYRVLFLAALVLFLFTFVFNTAAEIIRQRLRQRYSAL